MTTTDDRGTELGAAAARAVGASGRRPRRSPWGRVVLAVLVVLGAGAYLAWRWIPDRVDDGFIAFRPDASLFPAAPVADADTVVGIGRPLGWPRNSYFCPYKTSDSTVTSAFGNGWQAVRHDWQEDGENKAWFISERTVGFTDGDEFDEYVQSFRDRARYCGWLYGEDPPGFSSIVTELEGLPDDSIAFSIGLSPEARNDDNFAVSDPDDFEAMGAFIPGPNRGQVMHVMWIGWDAEVPRAEFVTTVNALYNAAVETPKPDYGDDASIDFSLVEFDAGRSGIMSMIGDDTDEQGSADWLDVRDCDRSYPDYRVWESSAYERSSPVQSFKSGTSTVSVGASRWRKRSDYLEAKDVASDFGAPPCVGSYRTPEVLIERIEVPGLPEGTVVSRWNGFFGAYGASIFDDDKQIIMTVTWRDADGPVPEDRFVEVANRAWDQFQADNP